MADGIIFNIQRFCVHDGPGIRTGVFFKGCPLHCEWCHNPEGLSQNIEISFLENRCIGCGLCAIVCPNDVHRIKSGFHEIDRSKCKSCRKCENACEYGAIDMQGKRYSVEDIVSISKRDVLFYGENGGVTFSGGEPMMQPDFAIALAERLYTEGLNVCIETSGFAEQSSYAKILPYVDRFLFDIKETDEERHKKYVGVGMKTIQENLQYLNKRGCKIVLRCPIIPDVNLREDHFHLIAELAESLNGVIEVNLEPYHPMGLKKGNRIGKQMLYQRKDPLNRDELLIWQDKMALWTKKPVIVM